MTTVTAEKASVARGDSQMLRAATEAIYNDLERDVAVLDRSPWGDRTDVDVTQGRVDLRRIAKAVLRAVEGTIG